MIHIPDVHDAVRPRAVQPHQHVHRLPAGRRFKRPCRARVMRAFHRRNQPVILPVRRVLLIFIGAGFRDFTIVRVKNAFASVIVGQVDFRGLALFRIFWVQYDLSGRSCQLLHLLVIQVVVARIVVPAASR